MTEIYSTQIEHPGVWNAKDSNKESFRRTLTEKELKAFDEVLAKTRNMRPQAVTREQFVHPDLSPLLSELFETIMHGRALVLVSGITHDRYSKEDFERIYWGIGTHLGIAAVQNPKGDRLGHVCFVPVGPDNPVNRAYLGNHELVMHTDTQELVGLMCVQKAKSGGWSSFVSALSLHNEFVAERPDLLPPLYEGFYFATHEASLTDRPVTPYKIPVFCNVDNHVSCVWKPPFLKRAGDLKGGLPKALEDAMAYMTELAERPDLKLTFMLEPGEMALWNNYTVLHSRTSYEDYDDPKRKRHLLRLWLDVPNGRPVIPVYHRDLVAGA